MKARLRQLRAEEVAHLSAAAGIVNRTQGAGSMDEAQLAATAASPTARVLGAFMEDALVGVATARVLTAANAADWYAPFGEDAVALVMTHKTGSLELSSVTEEWQGHGLGQRLTRARLEWLASEGCTLAVGVAWLSGLAHTSDRVFEKAGFRDVATAQGVYAAFSERVGLTCPSCGPPPCTCAARLYVRHLRA